MVNSSLNFASIFGLFCIGWSLWTAIKEKSAAPKFFLVALSGLIIFFQGWRLDPLLQVAFISLGSAFIFFQDATGSRNAEVWDNLKEIGSSSRKAGNKVKERIATIKQPRINQSSVSNLLRTKFSMITLIVVGVIALVVIGNNFVNRLSGPAQIRAQCHYWNRDGITGKDVGLQQICRCPDGYDAEPEILSGGYTGWCVKKSKK